jgi:hypothetical protein
LVVRKQHFAIFFFPHCIIETLKTRHSDSRIRINFGRADRNCRQHARKSKSFFFNFKHSFLP